jgi:hypothetical protein
MISSLSQVGVLLVAQKMSYVMNRLSLALMLSGRQYSPRAAPSLEVIKGES